MHSHGNQANNQHGKNKLRLYKLFKKNFEMESYLYGKLDKLEKKILSRIRLSSHNLEIESGRHMKIPVEMRLCKSCNMQKVGDEFHFIMECPTFQKERSDLFSGILSLAREKHIFLKVHFL